MDQTLERLGIDRMSMSDRLELIGQIWDSLDAGETAVATPDWHWHELERRRAGADADPQAGIPLDAVKARLAQRP